MALHRVASLPLSLRLAIRSPNYITSRHASAWTRRHSSFPSFFTRTPVSRFSARRALWLIPVAGGLTLYFTPQPQSLLHTFFASPNVIPCPPISPARINPTIFSPAEPRKSIRSQILTLLRDKIWEPIRTATRFIHLFVLFIPVIISSPMLLIQEPERAVWW